VLVAKAAYTFDGFLSLMDRPPHTRFPILVLDAASTTTHVGLGSDKAEWSWQTSSDESGIALFRGVASCLKKQGLSLGSVRTVIFCEGPGSMLGIRTAAMAIRTWATGGIFSNPSFLAYSSLALAMEGVPSDSDSDPMAVAIDARRKSWYCLQRPLPGISPQEIRRIPVTEMDKIASVFLLPDGFPVWNSRPKGGRNCPYRPKSLESPEVRNAILRPVERPDAFIIDPPVYQRWTPRIGRSVPRATKRP